MRSQKGQVPGWLKVVLVLLAIGLVGFIAICVIGFNAAKTAMNPEHASKVAHEIMNVQEPLPQGWKYFMSMPLPGLKNVSFSDASDDIVQIFEFRNPDKKTAEQFMSDRKVAQLQAFTGGATDKGAEMVGGQSMSYARGKAKGTDGGMVALEIGCIAIPGAGKIILIQSSEPKKDAFDPATVKPLLDSIKGFNG